MRKPYRRMLVYNSRRQVVGEFIMDLNWENADQVWEEIDEVWG
jgi:hypothetical protein